MRPERRLGLAHPLLVAPMAGGPSSVELVSAAARAGAMGFLGAAYTSPAALRDEARRVHAEVGRAYGINLFVPASAPPPGSAAVARATAALAPTRHALGLATPELAPPFELDFERQFEVVLEARPRAFSFVFGDLERRYVDAAHARDILVIGAGTTPDEVLRLAGAGVDAVVVQGVEAGGHRATFDPAAADPGLGTFALLEGLRGRTACSLIAAGGVMTGADVRRALGAGAAAVQMGTAFLATREAGTIAPYRARLKGPRDTRLTRAFSGRLARGVVNALMNELDAHPESILPYPTQNAFTRDVRRAGAAAARADVMSLWCGAGAGELFTGPAGDLIHELFRDA